MSEVYESGEDAPKCPWCGHVELWWEGTSLKGDGDTTLIECGACEKTYKVTMSVSYSFDTEAPEVCDECKEQCDLRFLGDSEVQAMLCRPCYLTWIGERGAMWAKTP